MTGAVVSSTRNTLVVRGDDGRFQLFVFNGDTVKPRTVAVGSRVRVLSKPGEEAGMRVAGEITVVEPAAAGSRTASTQTEPPDSTGSTANRTRHRAPGTPIPRGCPYGCGA